jgi:hypothetical protein
VVFAEEARAVAAADVEVAEEREGEGLVGASARFGEVVDDVFAPPLGAAVGAHGGLGAGFGDGDHVLRGLAVGGATGGEDEALDIGGRAGAEDAGGAFHIIVEVVEGLVDGFADIGEGGEVHDGVGAMGVHEGGHDAGVADVGVDEGEAIGGERAEEVEGLGVPSEEVVDGEDIVPALQEELDGVGPDVAGAAGDEDVHGRRVGKRAGLGDGARPREGRNALSKHRDEVTLFWPSRRWGRC